MGRWRDGGYVGGVVGSGREWMGAGAGEFADGAAAAAVGPIAKPRPRESAGRPIVAGIAIIAAGG